MKRLYFFRIVLFLSLYMFFISIIGLQVHVSANNSGRPPIFVGQVVVQGSPQSLPSGYKVIKILPYANLTVVKVEPGKELGQVQALRAKGHRAGLNLKAFAFQTPMVDDPLYSYQWNFPMIQSEQAWGFAAGSGVTVAILDTGLRPQGEDGNDGIGCIAKGIDIVNEDDDPFDADGHGTHVSGTVAQSTNNGAGVAGLAYGACIMPVKVLDDSGTGSFADIADGIYWAVDNSAAIINMSLGINARYGITNDPIMDPALDYAYNNGVTVICASGNDGWRKNVSYPAIYPTTIAVGAVGYDKNVVRYSNRGTGLDLVAPGGDITKDLNGDGYGDGILQETFGPSGWGYYFYQGTSMASPHVAAIAAMLIQNGTDTNPDSIFSALTNTAFDLVDPGYDKESGYGLVQAHNALLFQSGPDVDGDGLTTYDGDCDDNDPDIYPGAYEICGDNIDNNCDGEIDEDCAIYTDADGDGWCVEDGDCDDSDPHVYPGHKDTKSKWGRDGKDNDCNGVIDG